jgi:hypothetical protein
MLQICIKNIQKVANFKIGNFLNGVQFEYAHH